MSLLRFKPFKTPREIDRCIRATVLSAFDHVPAYRRLLRQSGVDASRVKGLADLPILPALEKQWLFRDPESPDRIHDRIDPSRCVETSTGGYTGLPVRIYLTRAEMLFRRLQLLAEWRRLVHLPAFLRVADVGAWLEDDAEHVRVRRGPVSILRVSNALPIEKQVRLISEFRPHVVSGYPTTAVLLAERWSAAGRPPRLIATRGEILHPAERATMAEAFGCRVSDFYNCEEIGNVASECPVDPSVLHVNTDVCAIEIVDDEWRPAPPGQEGRILLTSLYNRAMPFIRYFVGDRGTRLAESRERGRACACGSDRPRMAVVEGRDDDFLIMPDGVRLSPRIVATTVKRNADAKARQLGRSRLLTKFQVIQDRPDHVTVKIIREGAWPEDLDGIIESKLRHLHPALHCTFEPVENIPAEPSGKLKKVIRRIGTPKSGPEPP
jgi:phenylacetate-CoA ligase